MSDKAIEVLQTYVSQAGIEKINHWIAKYPVEERQSAVMSALMIVQEEQGYLSDAAMTAVANYLGMPPIAVFEVARFYSMYTCQPVGRHIISVCTNISCKLRDSAAIVDHLEKTLDVRLGQTTADRRFTLRAVECLGACVHAPMMQIDKDYHEHLTPSTVDTILQNYE